MKHFHAILCLTLLLLALPPARAETLATQPALPDSKSGEISPAQVKALRNANVDFLLIDCRSPEEAAQSRIPGSVLLPLSKLPDFLPLLELDKQRPMVVYCTVGARSGRMTEELRAKGFPRVWSLTGGIRGWQRGATSRPKN